MNNMNRLPGIVYHQLKGIQGHSNLGIDYIDVGKISSISYAKRLFCIMDRTHKFTITIEYAEPKTEWVSFPIPVYAGQFGIGIMFMKDVSFSQIITRRYNSEEECEAEISAIKYKQTQLDMLAIKLRNMLNQESPTIPE